MFLFSGLYIKVLFKLKFRLKTFSNLFLKSQLLKKHLAKGTHPKDIAFISFTNKAVDTARDRALSTFTQYTTDDFQRFKT